MRIKATFNCKFIHASMNLKLCSTLLVQELKFGTLLYSYYLVNQVPNIHIPKSNNEAIYLASKIEFRDFH